jgi:transcriptional regulator with XRE-family HTH domain
VREKLFCNPQLKIGFNLLLDIFKVFDIIEQKFLKDNFMDDSFGKVLRNMRLKAQIGLRELAAKIKKSPGYLSDVELDRVPPPSEAMILDIAKALNVNKKDLLMAAKKVDPELSEYVVDQPMVADFLRMAKDHKFGANDWERLSQLAKISRLGKLNEGEE